MTDFLHRPTLAVIRRGEDPDHPDPPYLRIRAGSQNDALLRQHPRQHLRLNGDAVEVLPQAERDSADAALESAQHDARMQQLDDVDDILRAVLLLVVQELNAHAAKVNEIRDVMANAGNLVQMQAGIRDITDIPTRTVAQVRAAVRGKMGT